MKVVPDFTCHLQAFILEVSALNTSHLLIINMLVTFVPKTIFLILVLVKSISAFDYQVYPGKNCGIQSEVTIGKKGMDLPSNRNCVVIPIDSKITGKHPVEGTLICHLIFPILLFQPYISVYVWSLGALFRIL